MAGLKEQQTYDLLECQTDYTNFRIPRNIIEYSPITSVLNPQGEFEVDWHWAEANPGLLVTLNKATAKYQLHLRAGDGILLGQDVLNDWIKSRPEVWEVAYPKYRRALALSAKRLGLTHAAVHYLYVPPDAYSGWRKGGGVIDLPFIERHQVLATHVFAYVVGPSGNWMVCRGDSIEQADNEQKALAFDHILRSLPHA